MNINQIRVGDRVDCYPVAHAPHVACNALVTKVSRADETIEVTVDAQASGVPHGRYPAIPVDEVLRRIFAAQQKVKA
jgi:hypothetical protein